jgi:hypothetical protein
MERKEKNLGKIAYRYRQMLFHVNYGKNVLMMMNFDH